jgi:hypothetical protein
VIALSSCLATRLMRKAIASKPRKANQMTDKQQPSIVPERIDFSCRVCGIPCVIAPDPPERAVCPEHCEDHNYIYSREDRGTFCEYCWQEAPHDYYVED